MRITNPMISNRMSININKNMRYVDSLYNQLSTGKKIIFPSDNPILASRALKFRTNVNETEQYQRNTSQGLSWMEVTEGAFKNVNSIMTRIRELAVQGTSDENRFDDRHKIIADMEELIKQLGSEMNVTYAGRYVFSGYRTDEPPIFEAKSSLSYSIQQTFSANNIETIKSYQRLEDSSTIAHDSVDILKLAYQKTDGPPSVSLTTSTGALQTLTVETRSLADSADAYAVEPGEVVFIQETGELVLGSDISGQMKRGASLDASYRKTGFEKGDVNPQVYFTCSRMDGNTVIESYNMDNQSMQFEFGTNTRITVNALAKDVYTPSMIADLQNFCQSLRDMRTSTQEELESLGLSPEEISEQMLHEENELKSIMHDRFNSLIGLIDKHDSHVTKQYTDMGSRMARLELIANRLVDDETNYRKLLSENEDVDYMDAIMNLNTAQSVYQASMQTGAKIIQLTLANYI